MDKIQKAAELAEKWHSSQNRKWTNEPYINHPARVAKKVGTYPTSDRQLLHDMICAAWLHDVIEDCDVSPIDIQAEFGDDVSHWVIELTNKSDPALPRKERKQIDRMHLAAASFPARLIKLADRTDNISDMAYAPPKFLRLYVAESQLLLMALKGTYEPFERQLQEVIHVATQLLPWTVPSN